MEYVSKESIDLHEFAQLLSDELGKGSIDPNAHLVEELGFDSLDFVQLAVICEQVVPGFEFPEVLEAHQLTLRDVHHHLSAWIGRMSATPFTVEG